MKTENKHNSEGTKKEIASWSSGKLIPILLGKISFMFTRVIL